MSLFARVRHAMKTSRSIPAMLGLMISCLGSGCTSKQSVAQEPIVWPSHHASLVTPSEMMLELASADDSGEWEWSRNDPQLGNPALPRDTSYRVVESRQWEVLGTSNGRPRDYSYTRIRTYSREGR